MNYVNYYQIDFEPEYKKIIATKSRKNYIIILIYFVKNNNNSKVPQIDIE